MSALHENFNASFTIDGWSLPTGQPNVIVSMEVIENVAFAVPMLKLDIMDNINVLQDELRTSSDNLIEVVLSRSTDDRTNPIKFRLFTPRQSPAAEGYHHVLYAMYDCVPYTRGTQVKSWKDTSSNVLKSVLGDCGLTVPNDFSSTDDKQVWVNPGLTRQIYARQLVSSGFKSAEAIMRLGVTCDGEARYVDVAEKLKSPTRTIAYGDDVAFKADYTSHQLRMGSSGGFLDSWVGHGYNMFDPRLDGKMMKSDGIALSVDGLAPLNMDTYGSVGAVRQDYLPFECGNTHKKYWQANHSNLRKSALLNQNVKLIIEGFTDIQLLDCVKLIYSSMDFNMDRADSIEQAHGGNYIVSAKKRVVRGNKYAEIFLLHKVGVATEGKATLVSDDSSKGKPEPSEYTQGDVGKSEWSYEKENRYSDPKDGCFDIIEEEVMPTSERSTKDWDDPEHWTDQNGKGDSPFELAKTEKRGEVKSRKRDTDPPKRK